jgi:hypothetical protein
MRPGPWAPKGASLGALTGDPWADAADAPPPQTPMEPADSEASQRALAFGCHTHTPWAFQELHAKHTLHFCFIKHTTQMPPIYAPQTKIFQAP